MINPADMQKKRRHHYHRNNASHSIPVSYTHLDVYKRQIFSMYSRTEDLFFLNRTYSTK